MNSQETKEKVDQAKKKLKAMYYATQCETYKYQLKKVGETINILLAQLEETDQLRESNRIFSLALENVKNDSRTFYDYFQGQLSQIRINERATNTRGNTSPQEN